MHTKKLNFILSAQQRSMKIKILNFFCYPGLGKGLYVNVLAQNKFRSTIHLLRQHLLAQSHQWKHQMDGWNLLNVNNKNTRLMPLTSFWCPYCYLQTHFTSCSSVFSASIVHFWTGKILAGVCITADPGRLFSRHFLNI